MISGIRDPAGLIRHIRHQPERFQYVDISLDPGLALPEQAPDASLVGRAWIPGNPAGPAVVVVLEEEVHDVTSVAPTVSEFCNRGLRFGSGEKFPDTSRLGHFAEILANSPAASRNPNFPFFLAPIDLHAIKAAGVTFVSSLLERVIEERTKGDPSLAAEVREDLDNEIDADLSAIRPGSAEAERIKSLLIARGLWSPYLEVGIGPDAEIFTKSQPMSAVGTGAGIGIHPQSTWNNPEPEVVLIVNNRGKIVGATLGNDVNLRDVEGRSALLLGRAKDNNGSCAVGPFIRLFDEQFTLDSIRNCDVSLRVEGDDGFELVATSSMSQISRDPEDLVAQTIGAAHQYPDGLALFTGTMFAPTKDRGEEGQGFAHEAGDIVTISAPELGSLVNQVGYSDQIPRWEFGTGELMRNLAARRLL